MKQLEQLKRKNLYEQTIDSLLNYIIVNDLKEGDRLPPEAQLKDTFGISRNTLREAIKSLQLIGLIDTKQNSGIVIKNFTIGDLTKFVPYTLNIEDKQLQNLFEAREWLEHSLLPMIVEKRAEDDLDKLQRLIADMDNRIANQQDIHDLDYQFHQTLVECCKNSFIVGIGSILREFFIQYVQAKMQCVPQGGKSHRATNDEHKIIYKCVAERNLPMLQKIYSKHLSGYRFSIPPQPAGESRDT